MSPVLRVVIAAAAAWMAYDAADEDEEDGQEASKGGKLLLAAAVGGVAYWALPELTKRTVGGTRLDALAQLGAPAMDEEDCGCDG